MNRPGQQQQGAGVAAPTQQQQQQQQQANAQAASQQQQQQQQAARGGNGAGNGAGATRQSINPALAQHSFVYGMGELSGKYKSLVTALGTYRSAQLLQEDIRSKSNPKEWSLCRAQIQSDVANRAKHLAREYESFESACDNYTVSCDVRTLGLRKWLSTTRKRVNARRRAALLAATLNSTGLGGLRGTGRNSSLGDDGMELGEDEDDAMITDDDPPAFPTVSGGSSGPVVLSSASTSGSDTAGGPLGSVTSRVGSSYLRLDAALGVVDDVNGSGSGSGSGGKVKDSGSYASVLQEDLEGFDALRKSLGEFVDVLPPLSHACLQSL